MNLCLNAVVIQFPDGLLDTCSVTAPRALLLPYAHRGHCKDESSYKECWSHVFSIGLTIQAQRPGARDAMIATMTLPPGSLQRMVRPRLSHPNGDLLGSYRIATAPEPNSSRLTSFKSRCFDSPANNVGPWPASLGCTTNSYSSINPRSANASGSFTPPTKSPLPGSCLSR